MGIYVAAPGQGRNKMDERDAERAKARELRRYEAAPEAWLNVAGNPPMEMFSPFGPIIARSIVEPRLVNQLNRYVDTLVTPGSSGEFHLPAPVVFEGGEASLLKTTEALVARYVASLYGIAPRAVRVEVFWAVSQSAGTPSPVHFHSSDISGVMYLKVPEIDNPVREEEKTYISNRQAGFINFMIGGRQEFSRSIMSFKPVVGEFYIFPGWLLHGAEPFKGTGERRSLAFNAAVEQG